MQCPICKKSIPEPKNDEPIPPNFPFCSDRCKLIDLNRWLTGRYQIPVVDREDPDEADPPKDNERT
jgi:endogenous inhibitor of DNA gyrase (YacG/DUF329 family)